jgi:hypothetical protein
MLTLMHEPTRFKMGQMAARFADANRVDEPFTAILDSDLHRRRIQERKDAAHRDPLELNVVDLVPDDVLYDGAISA